jgi:penicillin-binding protein 2
MSVFNDRKYVVMGIFIAVAATFILRLFYVQVFNDEYKLSANNNVLRYVTEYPARGLVYDRKGKLLVYNEAAYDLMVTPKQVKDLDTNDLCATIGISKEDFIKKLKQARQYSPYKASVFAAQLSAETYATLQEKLYAFKGFYVQSRTLRKYPASIAAHTLGYVGEVNEATIRKDAYYRQGDYIGISGIEKAYEKDLRGKKGLKILMVDVFNRPKGHFKDGEYDTTAITGADIMSTLDADLQAYGEKLLQNKTGGLVAIDPKTGEILACISAPSYNPNLLVGRERSKNYGRLARDPLQPLFNRALMAYYPPGSTFKLVDDLIALQEGVLTPEKTYPCPGGYHMAGHTVKCDARHGAISLRAAIQHSCNTYHCYVFRSIMDQPRFATAEQGYQNWRDHVLKFGVGKRLFSDLPQELRGMVPTVKYYDKIFGKGRWRSSTIVSLGIGQGELGITPLQMANIMCIIANKGYYYTPHIIRKVGKTNEHAQAFRKRNMVGIDPAIFDLVYDGMQDVVERGTAAASRVKDITILGKTGTAQNPHGKDHSLFVAFAPRENPRIAIGLMVENGGWGASWAAPIGTLMIEKYLHDTVARKDLEKRMMEGVVLPPHYVKESDVALDKPGTKAEEKVGEKKNEEKPAEKPKAEKNNEKPGEKKTKEKTGEKPKEKSGNENGATRKAPLEKAPEKKQSSSTDNKSEREKSKPKEETSKKKKSSSIEPASDSLKQLPDTATSGKKKKKQRKNKEKGTSDSATSVVNAPSSASPSDSGTQTKSKRKRRKKESERTASESAPPPAEPSAQPPNPQHP